jgi:hypothetical protein
MKLLTRAEFLRLPAGTFYVKAAKPWGFEGLAVKDEDRGENDWWYWSPDIIDYDDSGQLVDRLEKMLRTGCSFPLVTSTTDNGCYEEDAVFLVFEKDDLLALRARVDKALEIAS